MDTFFSVCFALQVMYLACKDGISESQRGSLFEVKKSNHYLIVFNL